MNIEMIWNNICRHEGEPFYTITNKEYDYVVKDDCILVKNDSRKRITKADFEKGYVIIKKGKKVFYKAVLA